ncbi:MAG TPA: flagellar biosynthesis protein FlhF [Bryobacteraceae bacterium]|nr:flagellar biosynthesis protein FlhF [Bryobacteraceae bacterium]
MRLKSYFASSVEAAMTLAAQELGPDAMLVHSRRATAETRPLGEYEVVFAVSPATSAGKEPAEPEDHNAAPTPTAPGVHMSQPLLDRLFQELGSIKKQMERTAAALNRSRTLESAANGLRPYWADWLSFLIAAEVDTELAHDIVYRLNAQSAPEIAGSLSAELEALIEVDATLGCPGAERRIIALIGPPGVGKTTTLVKLAARYGLACRRPAQILSTDVFRIGAAEQLRSCASILGIGFQTAETPLALNQALEECRNKDLILIDTPGFGRGDTDDALELAHFLSSHPEIDTHLLLSASTRAADLSRTVDQFEVFQPAKLLFTRLDETNYFGSILNEAVRTGKPVSFFSNGQRIPEDLELATKQKLIAMLLPEQASGHSAEFAVMAAA